MAAKQFYLPFPVAFNSDRAPEPGAKLYFYATGTTTPAPIYTTAALTTEHANPVVANAGAQFDNVYLDDTLTYRLVITDSDDGSLGVDVDPYVPGISGQSIAIGNVTMVSDRTALANIASPSANDMAYLSESGRRGNFVFDASDLSTKVTSDPQQGVYVAPTSDATGASGAWVREFEKLQAEFFGCVGDNSTDNDTAGNAAIAFALANGLRDIHFGPGTFLFGDTLEPASEFFGLSIIGSGSQSTFIEGTHNSGPVIRLNRSYSRVTDLTIDASAARTAGSLTVSHDGQRIGQSGCNRWRTGTFSGVGTPLQRSADQPAIRFAAGNSRTRSCPDHF